MSATIIRGFRLNNCKKCGAPPTVNENIGQLGQVSLACGRTSEVQVICSKSCGSPFFVDTTLVRAGRVWNRVN